MEVIGIALYPKHASTYEELFKKADEALYASKERGKDRYTFYISKEVLKIKVGKGSVSYYGRIISGN